MRKIGIVMAALACLMILAFAAQAATAPAADMKGQFAIGVQGGMALPMGKLSEAFDVTKVESGADMKLGPNFGAFVDYFVTKEIAVGVDGSYTTMNMKDQTIDVAGVPTTFKDLLKAKTMQFGVHGKYFLPTGGQIVPYLTLGAGYYMRKLELSSDLQTGLGTTESELKDNKFGGFGGVGVDYQVTPEFGVGVNGAYHMTAGKFEHDFGGTEGNQEILKDWNYISFDVALTYHIPMAKK